MNDNSECFKYDNPYHPNKCCNNIKTDESNPLVCPLCFRNIVIPKLLWTKESADKWEGYIKKDAELKGMTKEELDCILLEWKSEI